MKPGTKTTGRRGLKAYMPDYDDLEAARPVAQGKGTVVPARRAVR